MIGSAVSQAVSAAPLLAGWGAQERRAALEDIAAALQSARADIVSTLSAETGLTEARLNGELDRTTGQLRLFGEYVAAGRHLPGRVSPGAAPGGADITQIVVPLGPVAVFAASNFPLAFGVIGGDTASALAAGCPVVVMAHPSHPETGRLLTSIVTPHLPAGAFTVVEGGREAAIELVTAEGIRAVGFTGSLQGGRALMDAAQARPEPIPVFAEMGSVNPVFVLPDAATDLARAAALAASVTGSCGQLCTKPGIIVVPATAQGEAFGRAVADGVAETPVHRMLAPGFEAAHAAWVAEASVSHKVAVGAGLPAPIAVLADAPAPELLEEHFGPSVVVLPLPVADYPAFAASLPGQLTVTVQAGPSDTDLAAALLPVVASRAGRVVWNDVPTGVAVCEAMVHGGPWPATSASSTTSVGQAAVERFQRPVALQGVPDHLLASLPGAAQS